jgi:hypothetical protein
MFMVILVFVLGMLLPITLLLVGVHDDVLREIAVAGGVLILLVLTIVVLARMRPRREERRLKPPDPRAAAQLKFPARLPPVEFEAYCAEFLRQQGWEVVPSQSNEAYGTYLDATRPGARALLLCESRGELLGPAGVRTLAFAATAFPGARPVAVIKGRVTPATAEAAVAAGVVLLQVAELPRLAAHAALAEPATASGETAAPTPPPPPP